MSEESLDPFLAKMAATKVKLDTLDRKMTASGVSADSWGNTITEGGGYANTVHRSRGKAGHGV